MKYMMEWILNFIILKKTKKETFWLASKKKFVIKWIFWNLNLDLHKIHKHKLISIFIFHSINSNKHKHKQTWTKWKLKHKNTEINQKKIMSEGKQEQTQAKSLYRDYTIDEAQKWFLFPVVNTVIKVSKISVKFQFNYFVFSFWIL